MKEFAILGVPHGKVMSITQKAISLQFAKFHVILTPRPMVSTSVFLLYVMILGC